MFNLIRIAFACALCGGGAVRAAQTQSEIVWHLPDTVTADDRKAILEVARLGGVREPLSVSEPVPNSCLTVEVESKPVVTGNRVLSAAILMRQIAGPDCLPLGGNPVAAKSGNWVALLRSGNPRDVQRWRIHDGDWHADIHLGTDVPYDDAAVIVQAIRQRRLVDRRSAPESSAPIQYIDAGRIQGISLNGRPPLAQREYRIGEGEPGAGGGKMLVVHLRDDNVELHAQLQWMR